MDLCGRHLLESVYHVDHAFCFSLRLPTLDPGNEAKVGGSSEGSHPLLDILRLDSCIVTSATNTTNFNHSHYRNMNTFISQNVWSQVYTILSILVLSGDSY